CAFNHSATSPVRSKRLKIKRLSPRSGSVTAAEGRGLRAGALPRQDGPVADLERGYKARFVNGKWPNTPEQRGAGRWGGFEGAVRLYRGRGGLGRLRAGQPAVRRWARAGAGVGGRRPRRLDLVPYSGRLPVCDRQSARRLDVRNRVRARPQW